MVFQVALALWLVHGQTGRLGWNAVRQVARLTPPLDPVTGQEGPRGLWRGLRRWPVVLLIMGLDRPVTADPDDFQSYRPGLFWAGPFYAGGYQNPLLLFPMDSRAFAGQGGADDYTFNRSGGASWVCPYIAGLYALAAQANPAVTPEQFWDAAIQSGRAITIQQDGRDYTLERIVDPAALIAALREGGPGER